MNITLTDDDVLVAVTEYLSSRGLQLAGDAQLHARVEEGNRVVVEVTGVTLAPVAPPPAPRAGPRPPTAPPRQPRKPDEPVGSDAPEFSEAEQAAMIAQSSVLESGNAPTLEDRLRAGFVRESGGKPPTEWRDEIKG
jgi:hypothetical protein